MDKIWIIIKREYSVRVRKKSFIIMTLITPILLGLLIFAPDDISTEYCLRILFLMGLIKK